MHSPPWITPRTAYIHIPFCAHHCGYCDFAVSAGHDHLIELYLEALAKELATLGKPHAVESIFIGGGTPTHLAPHQLERLLRDVTTWLPLQNTFDEQQLDRETELAPRFEFSIEANPESFSEEKAAVLAAFGVNRISLGAQSFSERSLLALERRHTAQHIALTVEAGRKYLPVISLDLIFGAPGSELQEWSTDIELALALNPQHISTYGLTYEKGTPFWKQRHRGELAAIPEELELDMYEHAMDRLAAAGYEQYEISNFALPGYRCRHNERYWANEAYFGFGVGAARYINGIRELNVRDTKLYIRKALAGEPTTFQHEKLPPRARAFETMATQLRRAEGISRLRFHEQTDFALDELAAPALATLLANDILLDDGNAVRLTRRGKCLADAAVAELLKFAADDAVPLTAGRA